MTRFAAAFWVCLGLALALVAACQNPTQAPNELGGCTPTHDASCSGGSKGGGGSSGSSDSGGASDALQGGDAACGTIGQSLNSPNPQCEPCIEANCCTPDALCTANSACSLIVSCVRTNCTTNDPICVGGCENPYQTGVTDYNDLGSCLAAQCPSCPQLPQGAPNGDL